MSFFDEFVDIGGSGGSWVGAAEKQALIENGIPFTITAIHDDDDNQYGPRFAVFALVPDPETGEEEERKFGFAKVERDEDGKVTGGVVSRDRQLNAMKHGSGSYPGLDNGGDPIMVKLTKVGRSQILQQA